MTVREKIFTTYIFQKPKLFSYAQRGGFLRCHHELPGASSEGVTLSFLSLAQVHVSESTFPHRI